MRLTKDEILFIAIVLVALVTGAATKHYRDTHQAVPPAMKAESEETSSANPAKRKR